ncbi:MAG: amidohydrolase [Fervidicoccaceae archaeon]
MLEDFALIGKIYTRFSPLREAEGIVVRNGKIDFTGSQEEVRKRARELGIEIIDRRGYTIIPGFIDSHMHLSSLGLSLMTLDLRGTKSIEELKSKMKDFIERGGKKAVLGRGWDQELFSEGRWPRASDIDEVAGDLPAVLVRVCGHAAVLNSAALELLLESGIQDSLLQKDELGRPTGVVFEDAVGKALSLISEGIDRKEMLKLASFEAARLGVTSVGFMSAKQSDLEALKEMKDFEELKTRVFLYLDHRELSGASSQPLRGKEGFVEVRGVKLFADGSFGARTALLSEPYADDPKTRGVAVMGREELSSWIGRAAEMGMQAAVHAIGDGALDAVLSAFKMAGIGGDLGRVEHASLVRPDQLAILSSLGIGVAVQPHFVISDWWLVKRLGRERARFAYPFKTLLSSGISVGFSTDSPVEPLDPFLTVDAAVNRGKNEGIELFEVTKHERLSTEEALHCYTKGSASLLREESIGTLEEGKKADFIVLDRDPLRAEDLKSVKVVETFLQGRKVYP